MKRLLLILAFALPTFATVNCPTPFKPLTSPGFVTTNNLPVVAACYNPESGEIQYLNGLVWTTASINPAQSGTVRLGSGDTVCWRNAANTADTCMSLSTLGLTAYATVENAGTPLTQRTTINCLSPLTCADAGGKTTITGPAAGGTVGSSRVRAYKAASQSINNGSTTALTFDTNEYASGSAIHSTAVNPTRFTAPATGNYFMQCQIEWATGLVINTTRTVSIRLNGTTVQSVTQIGNGDGTEEMWIEAQIFAPLTAGDYFECLGLQRSGGALNAVGGIGATQGTMWTLQ